MLGTDGLTIYVAEADGEIVGTTSLLVMPNLGYDCHPTAFIEAMVVAEHHRRRGVGRRLMARLLDDARAASCRKVQLLSHKHHANDGAHDFYRSLGFQPEAEGFRLYLDTRQ
jgi:GNAT superfamily N-acetyltransferase